MPTPHNRPGLDPASLLRWLALLVLPAIGGGCAAPGIAISGSPRTVTAPDGFPIVTWELSVSGRPTQAEPSRGLLIYLPGSEPSPATRAIGPLAGAVELGFRVILVERRGVLPDGTVDQDVFHRHDTKTVRVQDVQAVISIYSRELPAGAPLVVLGVSEGGDVAAAALGCGSGATHLILLGSGGGWTQEQEFRHLVRRHPGTLGLPDEAALDAALSAIDQDPSSSTIWAGHTHRRWTSYLRSSPLPDLLKLECPVFLAHGDLDRSVPVESARAVRDAFLAAGRTNLVYREIVGADHRFQDETGDRSLHPLIELDLLTWFEGLRVISADEAETSRARVRRNHPEVFGP